MSEHKIPIPARVYNATVGGHVCGPDDIDFGQKVVHLIKYDRAGNEVSFESQVTQANKIYVIHDDFVLSSNVNIPSGCVLKFDGGSISGSYIITGNNTGIKAELVNIFNANVIFGGSWIVPIVYPEWFGSVGDGTTIDDIPFTKMADFINNNVNGHTIIKFGHKYYKFNTGIQIKKDIVINGGGVTLEYTVDTATEIYSGLTIGKAEYLKELNVGTVSGIKDSKVITISNNVNLAAGDYIVIEDNSDNSYSTERTYWHAGDILKVASVSGDNINVTESLTQDYSGASIVLYKLDVVKCHISDINFVCHYSSDITSNGIQVNGAVDSVLENLRGTGSWHIHFGINHCYNISASKCFVDCDTPLHGLNYGLVIGSSKNVTIDSCFLKTSRHGLATGGGTVAIPNRYLIITNCMFDGYTETSCLNQHTNAEYVIVANCYILNGFDSQASFVTLENSTIINRGLCTFGFRYYSGVKGSLKVFGNTFIMDIAQSDSAKDYVNLQIMQVPEIDDGNSIEIANNKFVLKRLGGSSHYQCHIGFINNGATAHKKVIIKGNTFEGLATLPLVWAFFGYNYTIDELNIFDNNFIHSQPRIDNTINYLKFYTNTLEGTFLGTYGVKKVDVIGNILKGSVYAPIELRNPSSLKDVSECIVSDNTIINCVKESSHSSSVYDTPFKIEQTGNVVIVKNTIITTDSATNCKRKYRFDDTNKVIIQNNKWWSVLTVLEGTANNATVIVDGELENAGATTVRPSNVDVGYQFFDTTLGKPIYWNGSSWVDATGATV